LVETSDVAAIGNGEEKMNDADDDSEGEWQGLE
jgi:hypothetical protein